MDFAYQILVFFYKARKVNGVRKTGGKEAGALP